MSEREKFEKWADSNYFSPHTWDDIWEVWQAALSTRKPYGWGVVDKEDFMSIRPMSEEDARDLAEVRNKYPDQHAPYRVVSLFYEEQS